MKLTKEIDLFDDSPDVVGEALLELFWTDRPYGLKPLPGIFAIGESPVYSAEELEHSYFRDQYLTWINYIFVNDQGFVFGRWHNDGDTVVEFYICDYQRNRSITNTDVKKVYWSELDV